MEIERFYNDFKQDLLARAGAVGDFTESIFTEQMCDFLLEQAVIEDYTQVDFKKTERGIRLDAGFFSEYSGKLTLIVSELKLSPQPLNLTNSNLLRIFKKVERYVKAAKNPSFYTGMDESCPGFEISRTVCLEFSAITSIHFILVSDMVLSKSVISLKETKIDGIPCSYSVWDLSRLYRLEQSGLSREDIFIHFTDYSEDGLACLPVSVESSSVESFLFVLPGYVLADLYDKYGERLLEQNVRTFLQFKGKVNKGLRDTIIHEPHMFFSYNNGLSVTAEEVRTSEDRNVLYMVKNLQIVNGGQTTASIFTSMKRKYDVCKVHVQVKMAVIPPNNVEEVIPKISEYANTQNKVNAADFFSNHPFHLRIEEFSRRIWAPSAEGDLRESLWFYERARGQYANAQNVLTKVQQKEFKLKHPSNQKFTKTDLAKYENCASMEPHHVSLGAQKNFAIFAEMIGRKWEEDSSQYNDVYFQHLIAKAIVFRSIDKLIPKQIWYGGYKANIVAYTFAKFVHMAAEKGKSIPYGSIWRKQKLSDNCSENLILIAEAVNHEIQSPPSHIKNITEWCKKEECWERIKNMPLDFKDDVLEELLCPHAV
jgi:hypothetical protein